MDWLFSRLLLLRQAYGRLLTWQSHTRLLGFLMFFRFFAVLFNEYAMFLCKSLVFMFPLGLGVFVIEKSAHCFLVYPRLGCVYSFLGVELYAFFGICLKKKKRPLEFFTHFVNKLNKKICATNNQY